MSEYLTIKAFADTAKVSTQSIYKRIKKVDNPIHAYIRREGDQVTIHAKALEELYGIKVELQTTQPSCKVEQPPIKVNAEQQKTTKVKEERAETAESKVIEILREQIQAQRKDIEDKNKQIEQLNERVADLTQLLDQQQKLSLADKKQLLLLEEKTTTSKGIIGGFIGLFKKTQILDKQDTVETNKTA